jgi:hypothetical protein
MHPAADLSHFFFSLPFLQCDVYPNPSQSIVIDADLFAEFDLILALSLQMIAPSRHFLASTTNLAALYEASLRADVAVQDTLANRQERYTEWISHKLLDAVIMLTACTAASLTLTHQMRRATRFAATDTQFFTMLHLALMRHKLLANRSCAALRGIQIDER